MLQCTECRNAEQNITVFVNYRVRVKAFVFRSIFCGFVFGRGEENFTVRVQIKTEHPEPFFGWLFQFGTKAEIVKPCELKEKYIEMLKEVMGKYSE